MALFQKVIFKKYLKNLAFAEIEKYYEKYCTYFHDPARVTRIKLLKEEQYQEGFFRELFVDCLNYTLNPDDNYNLTTEFKNLTDAEKADGAILKNGKPIAVIELKSAKTIDLRSIEKQAFNYKAHQSKCKYVITSNFEKIRLYIEDAIEFEEFNVFFLTKEQFKFLYLCLSKDSILNDVPAKIKEKSNQHEEIISKKLYQDYSQFRNKIFQNLVKKNPEIDKILLFKKSQKLLDRFLFIFFAEDKGLLPPNFIDKIITDYNQLKELDHYTPLYAEFQRYFRYIDSGYEKYNIKAYNGGLFEFDEILDTVKIDDEILIEDTKKLSNYDFDSEIDVNILGHIFEHSLTDIERLNAELSGENFDKKQTRRKKEGVFYTPDYITKYIVENTIGILCQKKKEELGLDEIAVDESYFYKNGKPNKKGNELFETLKIYKNWLLSLKILDPACGSGAFLNQAIDFLMSEHNFIINLETDLRQGQLFAFDIDIAVLENNLFGVDLNEESIEIAKLSLWLKTAKKGRKLTDLSKNIKCGNSLIDNPEIAGEKAFDWYKEFPDIFLPKDKKAWHVTTATHHSRYSARMQKYHVSRGEPVLINDENALYLAEIIAKIIQEDKLNIPAYNICQDHMHLIVVCEEEELPKILGKIKAITAKEYNRKNGFSAVPENSGTREHVPLSAEGKGPKKYLSLWTQKFGKNEITSTQQLENTVNYIYRNRRKHELTELPKMKKIIQAAVCSIDFAFRIEYKGGFDVVIGNPPYVFAREKITNVEKEYYSSKYHSAQYQINTYLLFIEKSNFLLKRKGIFGLIVPNAWLMVYSGKGLRELILKTCKINQIINLEGYSFEGVSVETIVIIAGKEKTDKNNIEIYFSKGKEFVLSHLRNQYDFTKNAGFEFKVFSDDISLKITKKMKINSVDLNSIVQIKAGLQAYEKGKGIPKQTSDDVKNRPYDFDYKFDENTYRYLEGKDVDRYFVSWSGLYLKYGKHLAAPRSFNLFNGKKIIIREITGKYPKSVIATYNEDIYLYNRSNIAVLEKEEKEISLKYVLSILNSSLMSYYFMKNTAKSVRKMFPKIILKDLRLFPFKEINIQDQQPFIEKADIMLSLNKQKQEKIDTFLHRLQSNFNIEKLSNKLKSFYDYDFPTFVGELKKKKVKLSLSQQDEWEEYFNPYVQEITNLQNQIDKTDNEIDAMVYELYDLTYEEIKIVEAGL